LQRLRNKVSSHETGYASLSHLFTIQTKKTTNALDTDICIDKTKPFNDDRDRQPQETLQRFRNKVSSHETGYASLSHLFTIQTRKAMNTMDTDICIDETKPFNCDQDYPSPTPANFHPQALPNTKVRHFICTR
jgi:hypothetical protein